MKIISLGKKKEKDIKYAVRVLKAGKTLVFPTPTCYGLCAAVNSRKGVKKICLIKGRSKKIPLSIVVNSIALLKKYGTYYELIAKIQKKYPWELFTFIVKRKQKVPFFLNPGFNKIGIIFARHGIHKEIVRHLRIPIVGTSANKSGQKECYTIPSMLEQFKQSKAKPDLILDNGSLPQRRPSTIVDILDEKTFKVLRWGNIKEIII